MLDDGRQDVYRHLVCMRIVDRDKLHTRVHQGRDEREVSGQAIELGDDEPCSLLLAGGKSLFQFWPVIVPTALDLGELRDEFPPTTVEIVENGLPLRLQAKPRFALPIRADAEIGDEFALMCRHRRPPAEMYNLQAKAAWGGFREYSYLSPRRRPVDLACRRSCTMLGRRG